MRNLHSATARHPNAPARWAFPSAAPCLLLAAVSLLPSAEAAGGAKLWELGYDVEKNPRTVFTLFCMTVALTMIIEHLKHKAEHATHGTHRGQALGAIFSELMMIGIVSFLLIVAAELGLTDLRIRKPGCEDLVAGNSSSSGSGGSGSGSYDADFCYFTFDLLMFEYAHLVLFFMGLSYGLFIQICFAQRNRYVTQVARAQNRSITEVSTPTWKPPSIFSIMGFSGSRDYARAVLVLRSAVVIHHKETIRQVCDPAEVQLEAALAVVTGASPPKARPVKDHAQRAFDFAKFTHIAVAEVLVELLHVPVVVWLAIIGISAMNLIHEAGLGLATTVMIFTFLGPIGSIFLLARMGSQLRQVVTKAVGHPEVPQLCYSTPIGDVEKLDIPPQYAHNGKEWAEGTGGPPWDVLTGCCEDDHPLNFLDLNDPTALEKQIQVIVFSSCFLLGQIIMLGDLIINELGAWALIICYIVASYPLVVLIPRAILLFTLIHKTHEVPRKWLLEALQQPDIEVSLAKSKADAFLELEKFLHQRNADVKQTEGRGGSDDLGLTAQRCHDTHSTLPVPPPAADELSSLPPSPQARYSQGSPLHASMSVYDMNQSTRSGGGGHHSNNPAHWTRSHAGGGGMAELQELSMSSHPGVGGGFRRGPPSASPTRSNVGAFPNASVSSMPRGMSGRIAPPRVRRGVGPYGSAGGGPSTPTEPTEEECIEVYEMISRSASNEHQQQQQLFAEYDELSSVGRPTPREAEHLQRGGEQPSPRRPKRGFLRRNTRRAEADPEDPIEEEAVGLNTTAGLDGNFELPSPRTHFVSVPRRTGGGRKRDPARHFEANPLVQYA